MKKSWIIRALLLVAYCVPFAFLSVNGDATSGTMLFYGVMIAGFALLCWGALKTNNVSVLYIGNVLSFVSSYAVAKLSGLEPMGHYFKPFTSFMTQPYVVNSSPYKIHSLPSSDKSSFDIFIVVKGSPSSEILTCLMHSHCE